LGKINSKVLLERGKRRAESFLRRFFAEPAHLESPDGRIPSSAGYFSGNFNKRRFKTLRSH